MRGLSKEFMTDLKIGFLSPILEFVHEDKDLILGIRDDYINIYYRCGNMTKLTRKQNTGGYEAEFDEHYALKPEHKQIVTDSKQINQIKSLADSKNWVESMRQFKTIMDYHFSNAPKEALEKYVQQLIVLENNVFRSAADTDYFIVDVEYQVPKASAGEDTYRFDLVGLRWDSTGSARKSSQNCKLAIIEVKYGDGAIKSTGNPGLVTHLEDARNFLSNPSNLKEFKEEMVTLFLQKVELELIAIETSTGELNPHAKELDAENIDLPVEVVFIIAGHKPAKTDLKTEVGKLNNIIKGLNDIDVKFATSSFSGYALYSANMKSATQFMALL
jgi:hypothetical protein